MEILRIRDAIPFRTHAEILNKVFQQKTRGGQPFRQYLRGSREIRPGKIALFINLAEQTPHGGWLPPRGKMSWINIPDPGGKAFTQIELAKETDSYFKSSKKDKEWAVFMHQKGPDGTYAYYFYGIFERPAIDKQGVCVFKRTATALNTADW
jgi:hypothetical protein